MELNTELVCHVGVVSGEKVPVITDRNPHLENLLDSKRCIYLPYSEDSNMVVDLPNMSGMFFTTQRITGADVFVCYDRKLSSNDNYRNDPIQLPYFGHFTFSLNKHSFEHDF